MIFNRNQLAVIVFVLSVISCKAQVNNLCSFQNTPQGYTCEFFRGLFENQNDPFVIIASPHLGGLSDSDVVVFRTSTEANFESRLRLIPSGILQRFPNLRVLSLERAEVETVSFGLTDCPLSLESLLLDGNNISSVPNGAFTNCQNLREISMENSNVVSVGDGAFFGLTRLNTLRLKNNSITELVLGVFNNQHQLQMIDLQSNKITKIDEMAFSNLMSLTSLSLSDNNVTEIGTNAFYNLESLEGFDLSYNSLERLSSDSISNLTALRYFRIDNNNITAIARNFFDNMPSVQTILARGNECIDSDVNTSTEANFLALFERCFTNYGGSITTTPGKASMTVSGGSLIFALLSIILLLRMSK